MAESTTAVYAVIDESKITSDNVYTQVSKTEQGKEAEATIQGPSLVSTTNADKEKAGASGFKLFACIFITIAFDHSDLSSNIVAEVSKLRAQNTSTAQ
jgi:hypothetical protein